MTQGRHTPRAIADGHASSIADLESQLDTTRHELADTVDQISARLDVKTRGKLKARELKQRGQVAVRSRQVQVGGGIAVVVLAAVIVLLVRRHRR